MTGSRGVIVSLLGLFLQIFSIYGDETTVILKFQGETAELPCRHAGSRSLLWVGPQTTVVGSVSSPFNDSRINLRTNGTLVIEDLQTTDAGKYVCMGSKLDAPEIYDEYSLPVIFVRKDHIRSLYTALAVSGCFFLITMTLYLLSEYKSGTFSSTGALEDTPQKKQSPQLQQEHFQHWYDHKNGVVDVTTPSVPSVVKFQVPRSSMGSSQRGSVDSRQLEILTDAPPGPNQDADGKGCYVNKIYIRDTKF